MTEPAETNEAQNPLTKPKFIISAVVVAILVVLGIALALLPKGGSNTAPAASSASTHSANAQPSISPVDSICGIADGDQSKPAAAPNTSWELVGKMAAPTSPKQYGPGKTADNGLRSCFAHSPTGALYAAANITILSGTGNARLVFEYLAVPSPERDAILQQAEPSSSDKSAAQIAGFVIRSYSTDKAVIDLAFKASNGVLVSIPVPLQWNGGDWKIIVPATGNTGSQQIHDLSGYIPWAGI